MVRKKLSAVPNGQPLGGVRGVLALPKGTVFPWKVERGAQENYHLLSKALAAANPDLYRNGSEGQGLLRVLANGSTRVITNGRQLTPLLVDSIKIQIVKEGKVVGDLPPAVHLNGMLAAETCLRQFPPVDRVTTVPTYLDDFTLAQPGYNDAGPGNCLLYLGPKLVTADSVETINRFLDVMAFASNADRTNTVAAALTVLLRHH